MAVMVNRVVMVALVNRVAMVDRTGQDRTGQNRHVNLTFQVTCDWQLSQFLRCSRDLQKPLTIPLA